MAVSTKHVLSQGPVLKTLAGVALSAVRQARNPASTDGPLPATPGEEFTTTIKPLPAPLLKD